MLLLKINLSIWWDWLDSNQRPRPYQGRTLTSWATVPKIQTEKYNYQEEREGKNILIDLEQLSSLKEVIQPQVPLRLPCYDFTPVADYTVVKGLKPCLKVEPTPMVWRAVCTRPGNVFTAARWSAITSNSSFMYSSCRVQSELRHFFRICLMSPSCFLL